MKLPEQVMKIYEAAEELNKKHPRRRFTPDGHFLGSIGDVIAAETYGLELLGQAEAKHDAKCKKTKKLYQIKITAGKKIVLSSKPDNLIVLKIDTQTYDNAELVYMGPGAPVWDAKAHTKASKKEVSLKQLQAFQK